MCEHFTERRAQYHYVRTYLRQLLDELVEIDDARHLHHLIERGVRAAVREILKHRAIKQTRLLLHHAQLAQKLRQEKTIRSQLENLAKDMCVVRGKYMY